MRAFKFTCIVSTFIAVVATGCHPTKKSVTTSSSTVVTNTATTTTVSSTPTETTASRPVYFAPILVSATYAPGNEELAAIQANYKEVTLDKLKQGYTLYTQSACIGCHRAFDIYKIAEPKWKEIIDDMAPKANISEEQKDAVYKYVLSVKATQPK